jgi:hypothetical protein
MDNSSIAQINSFVMKSLTAPCLAHPQRGNVTLGEAMYDFSFSYANNGRSEYYNYGAMREIFLSAGEVKTAMYQDDNNAWNAKIPMKVTEGHAVTACTKGGCNETELFGGTLSDEVYMRLTTKEFKTQGKFCLSDFKYLRRENTMGDIRGIKDLTDNLLRNIEQAFDHERGWMFYSDGTAIISTIKTVVTGNTKFISTSFRPVHWLQTNRVYAVYRPKAGQNVCLAPMSKLYIWRGVVEVVGTPDAAENSFIIAAATTKVDNVSRSAPTLAAGDVLVPLAATGTYNAANSRWTAINAADEDGYQLFAACAVEGLFSMRNYVGLTEYRCISTELYPMFKPNVIDCCDNSLGENRCKPFNPNLIWDAVQNQRRRTRGKYGATTMIMDDRTYEAMRQATLGDTRFTKFYSDGQTINIGAEAFMVKYDNMNIMVDNNMPTGTMVVTSKDVFKRITPEYDPTFPRTAGLNFVEVQQFGGAGGPLPSFVTADRAGNYFLSATAIWEYEYANMVPAATTIFMNICTDFSGCTDTCRAICA